MSRSTAFRLALLYVALFTGVATLVAVAVIWQTNAALTDQVLRSLRGEREELALAAGVRGLDVLATIVSERSATGSGTLYYLADAQGRKRAGNLLQRPPEFGGEQSAGLFSYASGSDGVMRAAAGATLAVPGGGSLVLARDVEDQRRIIAVLRRLFLWSFAGLALTGLIGGMIASRLLLSRIEAVSATSQGIVSGDLSRRIALTGSGDELDDLAGNLNAMLERIEQLMAGMREISDNIAHDLKTPLNRLRSRAEAALRDERGSDAWRDGLERVIEDADELIRTFNALLLIARLDAGAVERASATFDLADVVRDVADLYEPLAEERSLSLSVTAARGPLIQANRELIGQAIANLIDNAIKYAGRAGSTLPIDVILAEGESGIEIIVADRGPGIPPEDRERALGRFVRLDASRSKPGTGLGLNLVAAVARLHGGTVRLEDNAPGLKAVLALPARLVVSGEATDAANLRTEARERAHAGTG